MRTPLVTIHTEDANENRDNAISVTLESERDEIVCVCDGRDSIRHRSISSNCEGVMFRFEYVRIRILVRNRCVLEQTASNTLRCVLFTVCIYGCIVFGYVYSYFIQSGIFIIAICAHLFIYLCECLVDIVSRNRGCEKVSFDIIGTRFTSCRRVSIKLIQFNYY